MDTINSITAQALGVLIVFSVVTLLVVWQTIKGEPEEGHRD